MSEPRKQSVDGRSLFQMEKRGGRACPASIRDTAAIRDYHEPDTGDTKDPGAIERRLADIEAKLPEAVARALKEALATPETHNLSSLGGLAQPPIVTLALTGG